MLCRMLSAALGIALATGAATATAADYRGMAPGWPYTTNYAPAGYAAPGGYYAARPVTVAYANPNYLAAYGNAGAAYRPTVAAAGYYQQPAAAYYPPQTAYYAPQPAQYAPQTAQYAPSYSYAISPAGGSSAGSEAAAYYGQPTQLNYVPPQFSYRTNYAPVPVYAWRPVTAYDPVVGQPTTCLQPQATTCLQPQTTSTCQAQRSRNWFSWLNPHNWFSRRPTCGTSSPPPQTSYCTTNYCQPQCGTAQPYYPAQPNTIIQGVPAASQPPINLAPTYIPPAGSRIPSPPTRVQPGTTIINPADTNPRIIPGQPSSVPSGIPITPSPGSSFPSTSPPASGGGSFGTQNYAPSIDPYQGSQTAPPPSTTITGSGYRTPAAPKAASPRTTTATSDGPVIRAPELNSTVPPSVQTVPDLDAKQPVAPINRAPQLLSPRDKTAARGDERWAVVPAVWPSKPVSKVQSQVAQTKLTQPTPVPAPAAPQANRYDDSGWSSGRAW